MWGKCQWWCWRVGVWGASMAVVLQGVWVWVWV